MLRGTSLVQRCLPLPPGLTAGNALVTSSLFGCFWRFGGHLSHLLIEPILPEPLASSLHTQQAANAAGSLSQSPLACSYQACRPPLRASDAYLYALQQNCPRLS